MCACVPCVVEQTTVREYIAHGGGQSVVRSLRARPGGATSSISASHAYHTPHRRWRASDAPEAEYIAQSFVERRHQHPAASTVESDARTRLWRCSGRAQRLARQPNCSVWCACRSAVGPCSGTECASVSVRCRLVTLRRECVGRIERKKSSDSRFSFCENFGDSKPSCSRYPA